MDTTLDGLLNRRVQLEQPAKGFRVAIDTVLLAAAVPAKTGNRVLELGCGAGGAMLALACRVPGISITGIEIQPELVELCRRNIARNAFEAQMDVRQGDATNLPHDMVGAFDHVLMNPPYHDEVKHDASDNTIKRTANIEKDGDLSLWITSAAKALKTDSCLTLIHRADRMEEIIAYMQPLFGCIRILPLLPKVNAAPKRIIFRAAKTPQAPVRTCKNLVLHKDNGGYTEEAESILRHIQKLDFIE